MYKNWNKTIKVLPIKVKRILYLDLLTFSVLPYSITEHRNIIIISLISMI